MLIKSDSFKTSINFILLSDNKVDLITDNYDSWSLSNRRKKNLKNQLQKKGCSIKKEIAVCKRGFSCIFAMGF